MSLTGLSGNGNPGTPPIMGTLPGGFATSYTQWAIPSTAVGATWAAVAAAGTTADAPGLLIQITPTVDMEVEVALDATVRWTTFNSGYGALALVDVANNTELTQIYSLYGGTTGTADSESGHKAARVVCAAGVARQFKASGYISSASNVVAVVGSVVVSGAYTSLIPMTLWARRTG